MGANPSGGNGAVPDTQAPVVESDPGPPGLFGGEFFDGGPEQRAINREAQRKRMTDFFSRFASRDFSNSGSPCTK